MGRKKKVKTETEPVNIEPSSAPLDLSEFASPPPAIEPIPDTSFIEGHSSITITDDEQPIKGKRGRKAGTKNKTNNEGDPLIDGETLVMFIDIFFPLIVATANNTFSDKKISPDDLMLTDKVKSKMEIFANRCAERINVNVNPFVGLGVLVCGSYFAKFMEAKSKA